jgi:hypothetical protein
MTWAELEVTVRGRDAGVVTLASVARPPGLDARDVADKVAESVRYKAIGQRWVPLPAGEAARVLCLVLTQDLAYGASLMAASVAEQLAAAFMAHVGPEASFFTNGSWAEAPIVGAGGIVRGPSWQPITSATFDAGVVGVGSDHAAILWVEDED